LRGKADFPQGPFALASLLEVAVISIFVMKQSSKKYVVHVQPLPRETPQPGGNSKREMINAQVRRFAQSLEEVVKLYPEQWFNYYEFWKR
jgi:predicted LPLAT superfamily acyltransferase